MWISVDKENAFLKPRELRDLFDDMDLNGDGKVSHDELVDFLVEHGLWRPEARTRATAPPGRLAGQEGVREGGTVRALASTLRTSG